MTEQKRRGRPPKAEAVQQDQPAIESPVAQAVPDNGACQAYAMRVWSGQSPDAVAINERKRRVRAALVGQGFAQADIDAVTLPGGVSL